MTRCKCSSWQTDILHRPEYRRVDRRRLRDGDRVGSANEPGRVVVKVRDPHNDRDRPSLASLGHGARYL